MKHKIILSIIAILLCLALCGCGMSRNDDTHRRDDMDLFPETSPALDPDRNDGIVNDRDGIIGNGRDDGKGGDIGGRDGDMASPSPSMISR